MCGVKEILQACRAAVPLCKGKVVLYVAAALVCGVAAGCSQPDAQGLYEQGRKYRAEGRHCEAMQCFIEATQVRNGRKIQWNGKKLRWNGRNIRWNGAKEEDEALQGRIYSNIANMCRQAGEHELAYEVYGLSQACFAAAHDNTAVAYALNNRAWECAQTDERELVRVLTDSALLMCSDSMVLRRTCEPKAALYMELGEYDSVLYFTEQMTALGDTSAYPLILRAQALAHTGRPAEAVELARKVKERTENLFYLDNACAVLIQCLPDLSQEEWKRLSEERTTIQLAIEERHGELAQAVLLYRQQKGQKGNGHVVLWAGVLAALLVCAGLVLLFVRTRSIHREQAADVSQREQELERACEALRNCADLRKELPWNDDQQMKAVCDTRLMNIVAKLQERGLTAREIRICIPVLIGLSYSQTADLLCRAESGIGKDKYTIATKLGVSVKGLQQELKEIAIHR
jgi:tetratricopeptide (TPR) repeat protein